MHIQESFGIQITSEKPIVGEGVPLDGQSGLASQGSQQHKLTISLESWTYTGDLGHQVMIYFRIFTIFLATSFMLIVFYGDLATVKSLLAGLCGGFVAVVAAQNSTGTKLKDMEKHLKQLEAKLTEHVS